MSLIRVVVERVEKTDSAYLIFPTGGGTRLRLLQTRCRKVEKVTPRGTRVDIKFSDRLDDRAPAPGKVLWTYPGPGSIWGTTDQPPEIQTTNFSIPMPTRARKIERRTPVNRRACMM
jgi:hypothetical protein